MKGKGWGKLFNKGHFSKYIMHNVHIYSSEHVYTQSSCAASHITKSSKVNNIRKKIFPLKLGDRISGITWGKFTKDSRQTDYNLYTILRLHLICH